MRFAFGSGRVGATGKRGRARGLFAPLLAIAAMLFAVFSPLVSMQHAAAADWSAPSTVYIPETGHSIDGVFLDYWRNAGGIAAFGYPISAELQQNGHTVQYYQYARFEYWPDDADGNVVHLGKVGLELRPLTLLRSTFAGVGASSTTIQPHIDPGASVARIAMAWLPLDKKTAALPVSDSWVYVSETKHSVANGFKTLWENTGGADYLGNPLTQEYQQGKTTYQVFERGQLAWEKNKDPWQVAVGDVLTKKYDISTAPTDQADLPTYSEDLFVPPPTPTKRGGSGGEHWVDVSLSAEYLVAYEGDTPVNETYVSTGREGFETPSGTFFVNSKIESQTMEGVLGGEYYNVPDVPYVQYFTDMGHALHGTYWHSNFGSPMSHGCINLPMDFAAWLYDWSSVGMRVEVHF